MFIYRYIIVSYNSPFVTISAFQASDRSKKLRQIVIFVLFNGQTKFPLRRVKLLFDLFIKIDLFER